jgi:hypothetical protein
LSKEETGGGGEIVFGGAYGESGGATLAGKDSTFYYRCPEDNCIYQCMESLRPPESPPKCPDHGGIMIQVKKDECG